MARAMPSPSIATMLAYDRASRPPPPVTLPGRPAAITAAIAAVDVAREPRGPRDEHRGAPSPWAGGATPQPGDEDPTWTREQLVRMNTRFVDRVEKAIAAGLEHDPRKPAVDDPIAELIAYLRAR